MAHIRQATESDLASVEALLRVSCLPTEGVALHLPHFVVADAHPASWDVAESSSTDVMRSCVRSPSTNTCVVPVWGACWWPVCSSSAALAPFGRSGC
ncbi:hypothetical protein [Burkholderia cenocepacia]|uniref:hypothetical protein n=1 Tax=Burkholderia cenocepacia TaxID=95486 RepID=UPI000AA449EB|nr:hypothetical protein [Burkholderia cenocepacia]